MRAPIAEAVARDLADPKLYAKIAARHGITPARHAVEHVAPERVPTWAYLLLALIGAACIAAVVIA